MKKIFIRFPSTGKLYSYNAFNASGPLKKDEMVLVETDQIIEEGRVVERPKSILEVEEGTGKILRKETAEDKELSAQLKHSARQYIEEANAKAFRHGLKMKILDAEFSFDQKKLTFYFTAAGRIDFRSLVSDMAKTFNKLIRLQQVGGRVEAKYFGGFGKCGRELCCTRFLGDLQEKDACLQTQEISGAPKLTGCCGKKMCCLAFENELLKSEKEAG